MPSDTKSSAGLTSESEQQSERIRGLFKKHEGARYLNIGLRTLDEKLGKEIPFIKLGDSKNSPVRLKKEDLDTYIETRRVGGSK